MIGSRLFSAGTSAPDKRVGLELELFPVDAGSPAGTYAPVPLRPAGGGEAGLFPLLESLAGMRGGNFSGDDYDSIAVEFPGGGRITLEPAGQVEYSGPPLDTPALALDDLRSVVADLEKAAENFGVRMLACGYNRHCSDEDLQLLIRKPRYLAMDRHFSAIGPFGRRMMRATCSLQINLDFGPTETVAERWRLANMIAPSLNVLFANSPHCYEGRQYRSFRYEIWRHADPARTGRLYDRPDLDPVADYLRFALDASVMFLPDGAGGYTLPDGELSFRQWMAGTSRYHHPDWNDWLTHLTTLFPDVRARGWMEFRSIDALPAALWDVPVALAATLMYDDELRRTALERLEGRRRRRDPLCHEHNGFWHADHHTGIELLELAIPAISDPALAASVSRFYEEYALPGITPGEKGER